MIKKFALSFAVLALIGDSSARHHSYNYLQFIDGNYDEEAPRTKAVQAAPVSQSPYPGVRFVQAASDPIHGSLGAPKAKRENLTPEQ
jgi:hypothetical protein